MARSINMELLEQKIHKAEQEVAKAKSAYDTATAGNVLSGTTEDEQ